MLVLGKVDGQSVVVKIADVSPIGVGFPDSFIVEFWDCSAEVLSEELARRRTSMFWIFPRINEVAYVCHVEMQPGGWGCQLFIREYVTGCLTTSYVEEKN